MSKGVHRCPVCKKEVKGGEEPRVVQHLTVYTTGLKEMFVGYFHLECWNNWGKQPPGGA